MTLDPGATNPTGERARRLRKGIGAALPARAAQALAPLVAIPWLLEYLGLPLYGFWVASSAVVGMLSFSDLGLGNAVMSRLPRLLAEGDVSAARSLLSSSYGLLTLVSVLLAVASGFLAWLAPLDLLLAPGFEGSPDVLRGVFLATCLTFVANMPMGLVFRVQLARQRAAQAYLVAAFAALLSMPLTLLAITQDIGPAFVVAVNLAIPPLVNLCYTIVIFASSLRGMRPTISSFSLRAVRDALNRGLPFLGLTILLAATSGVDYLLIGHLVGPSQVAEFSVPARLLAQMGALVSLMNIPFWSASSEALARRDVAWVDVTRRRLSLLGFSVTAAAVVLLVFAAAPVYEWWLGGVLTLSPFLVAGLGVWWIAQATLSPTFMVQNGAEILVPQAVGFTAYLLLSIPLKLSLVPTLGVASVAWISAGSFLITVAPAAIYGYSLATKPLRLPVSPRSNGIE